MLNRTGLDASAAFSPLPPFSALQAEVLPTPPPLRAAVTAAYRRDEQEAVQWLLAQAASDAGPLGGTKERIAALAAQLVRAVRARRRSASGVDALMHEFSLSSEEGVALMCLAEALLRIPDRPTADRLIADKIGKGDWKKHLGESPSLFVNAATWGLLITGKLVATNSEQGLGAALNRLIAKGGEPLIRKGVDLAMRLLGKQFVCGRTIEEALANSRQQEARGYRHSYDMLGEAALTAADAARYTAAYESAIHAIGRAAHGCGIKAGPGISVKLSALHPRYARARRERVMNELLPSLKRLTLLAKSYDIGLNIDAEEADRLELSLDLMEALAADPDLAGFDGIGFVAQAYQKRCPFVIDFLVDLARRSGRNFMLRLVKGAYWDAEIKRAQVDGMPGYPVYTRKVHTDVSYLLCAQKLLAASDVLYPQFATHNAQSLAAIHSWARARGLSGGTDYEFQCLHGMGETLYDEVLAADKLDVACRIYAPVGSHETLLAYLVRRLLENGANSSFVHQLMDEAVSLESLIADPFEAARMSGGTPHPRIPLPSALYGAGRKNSAGLDLSNEEVLRQIAAACKVFGERQWQAAPLLADMGTLIDAQDRQQVVLNPADRRDTVGHVVEAGADEVDAALGQAENGAEAWAGTPAPARAAILLRAAALLETHRLELMALAIREAGKSLPNAIAEVREAVDFLRYYTQQISSAPPAAAIGPVVCISPWNFPLAIFIGQVSAALAAGNVVLAKPAEQTTLIAHRAVQVLHEAGVPRAALQFLPGRGETVGSQLTADARVRGVLFTGSTKVAQAINRTLATRMTEEGSDIALVAETGGQNAMIVDSSALPEQVVQDVLSSAFDSAGQRCSALRVLCLQSDVADKIIAMLQDAMRELRIGCPDRLATDIGPVIDETARAALQEYVDSRRIQAAQLSRSFLQLPLPPECVHGSFVAPAMIEIDSLARLQGEVFGPVLHVLRYRREELPALLDAINASGYGLTLGVHTRIDETIDYICAHAHVGNIYVNRNIVGAVVGVQPFGGEEKSGTGPKAGGPLYLARLSSDAKPKLDDLVAARPSASTSRTAFGSLCAWAKQHSHIAMAELGASYADTTLLDKRMLLPGPTGERNTLHFAPRGAALCKAAGVAGLLQQMLAAFASGNRVVLFEEDLALLPASLPGSVRDVLHCVSAQDLGTTRIDIALLDRPSMRSLLPLLTARSGAVVPVLVTEGATAIPLWRLVTERAVCINTAAAGGNASLMTLSV